MHVRLALLGFCLAFGLACHAKKNQESDAETGTEKSEAQPAKVEDAQAGNSAKQKKSIFELYPPVFTIYPLSRPEPSHPLYFGYAADAERPFQTVFPYVVAVEPNLNYGESAPPTILDSFAYEAFMNDWAVEFQKHPELVQKLKDLAGSFAWQVDGQYIEDKAEVLPDRILDGQPFYVRATQIMLARRFTFKMPGVTEVKGDLPDSVLKIGFDIKTYTKAQIDAGKARYERAGDACSSCHAGPEASRNAFLKHSSDYMAYYTDAQLIEIIKNSNNPDGSPFLEGLHVNALTDATEEAAVVAYLRNMLPWYDKAQMP